MQQEKMQYLYWSLSKPIKYLGLTVDEWVTTLFSASLGFWLLNTGKIKFGLVLFLGSFFFCYLLKKIKNFSKTFSLKSFFIAKGILLRPAALPNTLYKKRVGR